MANWYLMLKKAMEDDGEDFSQRVCTLTEHQLLEEFDGGYGSEQGAPFTAWGKDWVYFPICYDGAEWVGHAPRNPCVTSMEHQGG